MSAENINPRFLFSIKKNLHGQTSIQQIHTASSLATSQTITAYIKCKLRSHASFQVIHFHLRARAGKAET
jgi:hypothetical protein